jgi:methionine-rich copper-binding protein CopC
MIRVLPLLLLPLIGIGYLIFLPNTVYGHASPVTYDPRPNQIFNSAQAIPDKLTIGFSETPEVKASNIKVLDKNNARVDKNDLSISAQEKKLSISMDKPKIKPGTYTVNWLVLSKDDGHITKGAYVFTLSINNNKSSSQQPTKTTNQTSLGYSKSYTKDNANITLGMQTLKAGMNTFNITVHDNDGKPAKNISNVFLTLNNPDKSIGPIVDTMKQISTGEYSSSGSFISQPGNWDIKVIIQRTGEYDINQVFPVNIN